jgi:hypothetical protein
MSEIACYRQLALVRLTLFGDWQDANPRRDPTRLIHRKNHGALANLQPRSFYSLQIDKRALPT